MLWHFGRPRQSTVLKAMGEQTMESATISPTQSLIFCCTLPTLPGPACIPSYFHLISPITSSLRRPMAQTLSNGRKFRHFIHSPQHGPLFFSWVTPCYRWISLHMDNVADLLGHSMVLNICMDGRGGFPTGSPPYCIGILPNSQPTMYLPCHVKPLARLQVEKLADCKDHHWWQEKPAQLMPQLSREPLQSKTASYDTWQWEHMRACYSSSQLWLSMMRPNSTGMEGGSPLVWTMLYPPLETARLQTYTWDGHLNNFMPWTTCNPDLDTRPPLTAHAMWNLWKGSNLLQSWKCTETSHHL